MAKMNENELKAYLRSAGTERVFLLYGDEKVQVRHYLEKIREKTVGKTPDPFSLRTITAENNMQQLSEAIFAAPAFLAGKVFVSVLDYDFTSAPQDDMDKLLDMLPNTPENIVLVFAYPASSPSFAKGGNRRLLGAVEKCGITVNFEQLSDLNLEKQLVHWAAQRNVKLKEYDAARIVTLCGRDLSLLKNELNKLCAYRPEGEITRDDIDKLVNGTQEARIFDIANLILSGQTDRALAQTNILLNQRESPQTILSILGGVYVDLYRVRAAQSSGVSLDTLAKQLNYGKRSFALQRAQKNGRRIDNAALRKSLNAIAQTNAKMNSSSISPGLILEELIVKLSIIRTEVKS